MFGFFKKKSEKDKLLEQYNKKKKQGIEGKVEEKIWM